MVKIGSVEVVGSGFPLPRERSRAKQTLKSIAKCCGVNNVYFVRTKHAPYGGLYDRKARSIIVVEQEKSRKVPMWLVAWRFFHELTHHLHAEGGLFDAYYFEEVVLENGCVKKFTQTDRKRVALRAERHANQKACEMAEEFFGIVVAVPDYPKEFLQNQRGDIFG